MGRPLSPKQSSNDNTTGAKPTGGSAAGENIRIAQVLVIAGRTDPSGLNLNVLDLATPDATVDVPRSWGGGAAAPRVNGATNIVKAVAAHTAATAHRRRAGRRAW